MALQHVLRDPELAPLDLVGIGHDRAGEHVARPGDRRDPFCDHAARTRLGGSEREPALPAEIEHQLLDRTLVAAEQVAVQRCDQTLRELVRTRLGAGLDDQVDMDLEVTGADRRLHPVAVAARIRERLRDRGLTYAEEAEPPQLRRLRIPEEPTQGFALDCLSPQALQLGRRARQDDDQGVAMLEHEAGRGAGEPK